MERGIYKLVDSGTLHLWDITENININRTPDKIDSDKVGEFLDSFGVNIDTLTIGSCGAIEGYL